ncbi:uncharacterized protein METZ01_LOCUS414689, partial [marine metagenome]
VASLAIIGLGLIGGSIAAGLKKRNPDYEIAAWDRNPQSLELGLAGGLIDASLNSAADIDTDLVVLALPVRALEELLPCLDFRDAVVTDVGSVKGHVLETFNKVTGAVPQNFVPGHPIAGSEQHGVAAADPDLFSGHRVILTPLADTDTVAADKVAEMWRELGATISYMTPEHHDQVLAQTSHLPHLLAYALVDTLSQGGDSLEVFQYAAGGFRDFSRIAASDPVMWRDIFLSNAERVVEILDRYVGEVASLR